jgi:hypothetical protein
MYKHSLNVFSVNAIVSVLFVIVVCMLNHAANTFPVDTGSHNQINVGNRFGDRNFDLAVSRSVARNLLLVGQT